MDKNFSALNLKRCDDPNAFNCADNGRLYWVTALTEELGEIAGIVKKLEGGFNQREYKKICKKLREEHIELDTSGEKEFIAPDYGTAMLIWSVKLNKKLALEMADLNTYLDLLASKEHINLEEATINKFNIVSEEMGLGKEYFI